MTPDRFVTKYAGTAFGDYLDTLARYARLKGPYGLAIKSDRTICVSDHENGVIRQKSNGSVR